MKRQILTLLISVLAITAYSQKKAKDTAKVMLPMKDGLIFYESIIDSLEGQNKDDLFSKSVKWMADSFVDSKEVIQIKDKEAGSIVGSGTIDYVTKGFLGGKERMSFMVEITVKDFKSRMRLYQFKYKTFGSAGYGSAVSSSDSDYYPVDKPYQSYLAEKTFPRENKKYYVLIDETIQGIISSYKTFLKNSPVKDDF